MASLGLSRLLIPDFGSQSANFVGQSQFKIFQFPFLRRQRTRRLVCSPLRLVRQWLDSRVSVPESFRGRALRVSEGNSTDLSGSGKSAWRPVIRKQNLLERLGVSTTAPRSPAR
jgi:hypothetical protein